MNKCSYEPSSVASQLPANTLRNNLGSLRHQILYAGLLVDDTIEDSESDDIDAEQDQVGSLSDKVGESE